MTSRPEHEITGLLRRVAEGDSTAADELLRAVQEELHVVAAGLMRHQPTGHTLQTTALVNEAWLRLAAGHEPRWEDRHHFFKAAARAMRSVLVDHARKKSARKRDGGGERVPLDDLISDYERLSIDVLALNEGIERLFEVDPQVARIVELRFFAGLSIPETAQVLEVSTPTVERGWRTARAMLHLHLAGESLDGL